MPIHILLLVASCGLIIGCNDDSTQLCDRYAETACETDTACDGTNPCSVDCEALEVEDAEALETCTSELAAIPIPDRTAEPLANAQACTQRYTKHGECTLAFVR